MYRQVRTRLLLAVFLAVLALPIITSCSKEEKASTTTPAATTQSDLLMDPIKLDSGYVSGTMVGDPGKEVRAYRGIPYAAPPVGDLRWKAPQPVVAWSGIREATVFGNYVPPESSKLGLGEHGRGLPHTEHLHARGEDH